MQTNRDDLERKETQEKITFPAFYEAGPGDILWVDFDGRVINGDWTPDYSHDRHTCWDDPCHVFKWVAKAPSHGNYNDVIESFLRSRGDNNCEKIG